MSNGATSECRKLVKRMERAGCRVDRGGSHLKVYFDGKCICTFSQNIHSQGLVRIIVNDCKKNGVRI